MCLMLDGGDVKMADANGNGWNATQVTLAAARTTRTLRHLPLPGLQGSCQPYHSCSRGRKRRLLRAPPLTPALSSYNNPPHNIPLPSTLLSLIPPLPPTPTQPPRPPQTPSAFSAPTATSFACDSPAKSDSIRKVSYVCSSYALTFTFTFTCAQSTRFKHERCRRWQAEGGARSGLLVG